MAAKMYLLWISSAKICVCKCVCMCIYIYVYIYICITGSRTPQCEYIYILIQSTIWYLDVSERGVSKNGFAINMCIPLIYMYIHNIVYMIIYIYVCIYCKYTNNHQPNYQLPPQSCRRNSPWASTSDTNKAGNT